MPIIVVTLMLFSQRARVNGPMFLLGWVIAVTFLGVAAYNLADQSEAATSSTAVGTIAGGKIVFGVLGLGVLLGGAKNLLLVIAAGAALARASRSHAVARSTVSWMTGRAGDVEHSAACTRFSGSWASRPWWFEATRALGTVECPAMMDQSRAVCLRWSIVVASEKPARS